jgi:predicted DNA-binding protein (MmcQ/YjbR family)
VNLDPLRRYCSTLPGATRDIKWGADEVYSVGGKMFAVFCVDGKKAKTASFKCDPERFLELTDQPGIVPAPYLARAHWVQVQEAKSLTGEQARELLADRIRWSSPSSPGRNRRPSPRPRLHSARPDRGRLFRHARDPRPRTA